MSADEARRELHAKLLAIVIPLEGDYQGFGNQEYAGADCSCGCKHFVQLAGDAGADWGVCANPKSHRVGLLTFEHQGCPQFEGPGRGRRGRVKYRTERR